MGVVTSINVYKKAADCIVGHVNILGIYEVKEEAISAFKVPDLEIFHYGEIYLITEIMHSTDLYMYNIGQTDLYFYNLAPSPMSGEGYGEHDGVTTCLMFDPAKLLPVISNLVDAKDDIIRSLEDSTANEIKRNEEPEMLLAFKNLLEQAIEKDGIVKISFG